MRIARMRLGLWVVLLGLGACESTPGPMGLVDARAAADASSDLDASDDLDATMRDASVSDASVVVDAGIDGAIVTDAGWGACVYGGAMGTCMSVSDCTAPDRMPVAGLCPGPADIQCCLPASTPGMWTPSDVIARLGSCTRIGGDYAKDGGGASNIPVCETDNVIWWTADFDVDCDGGRGAVCMSDPDYLPDTSAVDSSGNPLDASTLPFIVIPLPSARFRYADHAIRTGQVALVLFGDRMVFGIFGDAGPASIIGEGSFAMAEALGIPSSPRTGGVDAGVAYLVFTGTTARVTRNEDHGEAVRMGEALLDTFLAP